MTNHFVDFSFQTNRYVMVKAYIIITTVVGQFIWLTIGLVFWIPILLVAISNFFYAVLKESLVDASISSDVNTRLKNKINMYSRGFKNFSIIAKSFKKYGDNS